MVFVRTDACKGCGICVSFCPQKILAFSDDYNSQGVRYPRVTDQSRCVICKNCMIYCPDFAMVAER
jgi:2-oxoglutarate ferredoxin oxidoreductase subunit delta